MLSRTPPLPTRPPGMGRPAGPAGGALPHNRVGLANPVEKEMKHHDNPAARNAPAWKQPHQTAISEAGHDPYRLSRHYPEGTRCPACGASYERGRWSWTSSAPTVRAEFCPACRRIHDAYPAGVLELDVGSADQACLAEVERLVDAEASAERSEHPLHRVIASEAAGRLITITTTDIHTPRRIGAALEHALGGSFTFSYAEDETAIHGHWNAGKKETHHD